MSIFHSFRFHHKNQNNSDWTPPNPLTGWLFVESWKRMTVACQNILHWDEYSTERGKTRNWWNSVLNCKDNKDIWMECWKQGLSWLKKFLYHKCKKTNFLAKCQKSQYSDRHQVLLVPIATNWILKSF